MTDEESQRPESPAEAQPAESPQRPVRPVWSYFLTPAAVVLGAAIIAGAVWLTADGGDDDLTAAIHDLQAQVATLQQAPGGAADGGEMSTARDLRTVFNDYVEQVGADTTAFNTCLSKQSNIDLLNAHVQRGSALGVTGTPTFFINNKKIVGSQPQAIFEEVIEAELNGSPTAITQYSEAVQQLAATSPPRFEIMSAPVDLDGAVIKGPADAEVVIAEFSDFQCPFCKRWTEQTMDPLLEKYGDDVSLAFLHFPITQIHPNAGNAAVAAICAGEQGKFWEMHDLLFARQQEWQSLQ